MPRSTLYGALQWNRCGFVLLRSRSYGPGPRNCINDRLSPLRAQPLIFRRPAGSVPDFGEVLLPGGFPLIMDVSILLCTRNRVDSLRDTLRSIAGTKVPSAWQVELVIVDNGSTDDTRAVAKKEAPSALNPRCVVEPKPGLSHARNRGIAESTGQVLLFTDDDVRVPSRWIGPMATPILEGKADAVAGGVRLTDELRRSWMSDLHASLLADTTALQKRGEARLVGANMAIGRSVFDTIPGFDPELGAGHQTFGFHEETLLTLQMRQAGLRLETAYDVVVEHRPKPDRIQWDAYGQAAEKLGRSDAYLDHHWRHATGQWLRSLIAGTVWSASFWVFRHLLDYIGRREEGMSRVEMNLRRRIAYHRQMLDLVGAPRKYKQYGARKRPQHSFPEGEADGAMAMSSEADGHGKVQ